MPSPTRHRLSLYCGMTDEEFDYLIVQTDKAMYA
jgi:hypothetical protein